VQYSWCANYRYPTVYFTCIRSKKVLKVSVKTWKKNHPINMWECIRFCYYIFRHSFQMLTWCWNRKFKNILFGVQISYKKIVFSVSERLYEQNNGEIKRILLRSTKYSLYWKMKLILDLLVLTELHLLTLKKSNSRFWKPY